MKRFMKMRVGGFTLIELLVVIAIHRHPGGDVVAGIEPGAGEGAARELPEQPEADRVGDCDVFGQL